jgi:hypothetical protein
MTYDQKSQDERTGRPPITNVQTVMSKVTVDKIKPISTEDKIRQGGVN